MSTGIALIGSGGFVQEWHLPAILENESLTLKAVYSRSLKSASALTSNLSQKVDWYSEETADQGRGYDDLLTNTNIRAVIIALPIPTQPPFIKKALAAGKHVLAEKPLAKDVSTAKELLDWYRDTDLPKTASLSIAENWRFKEAYSHAAQEVLKLGKIQNFSTHAYRHTLRDNRYVNTKWRQEPEFQGGRVFDSGVHFVAATRLMLGTQNTVDRVSAFTGCVQDHLKPLDTLNATWRLKDGTSGVFAISLGSRFKGETYSVACERGIVSVHGTTVTITDEDGNETSKTFSTSSYGVHEEIAEWVKGINAGDFDKRLQPEEAFKDVEILEAMLNSGKKDGAAISLAFQDRL